MKKCIFDEYSSSGLIVDGETFKIEKWNPVRGLDYIYIATDDIIVQDEKGNDIYLEKGDMLLKMYRLRDSRLNNIIVIKADSTELSEYSDEYDKPYKESGTIGECTNEQCSPSCN